MTIQLYMKYDHPTIMIPMICSVKQRIAKAARDSGSAIL